MKKDKKSLEWVEFADKIVYVCEKLFGNDVDKLIFYFTDQSQPSVRKSRKKTIENWLSGKSKKPNGFHLFKFKINSYELNGEPLFTVNSFQKWSFVQFKKRVDSYLAGKNSMDIPNEMKYIYFFNTLEKRLGYFEINYPNEENSSQITLNSPLYTSDMTYRGTISNYNNMTYISVKNEFDYLNYIFKNNVHVYRKELKVFGVAQCVDAPTREPKSYMALLTSSKLTAEEERNFSHKMNFSNLMIADDFTHGSLLERNYFFENFSDKIYNLSRDIEHYGINESFSKDMYYDIVLKEYKSYITLLEKSLYHSDYPIDHKRQSILFALEDMCRESGVEATIAYHLTNETINILDSKNSIMEMQLKLVTSGKLALTYLFIIQDLSLLTDRVVEQIRYLEKNGIRVTLTECTHSIYTKILLVKNKDFAIYKRKNELDDNNVTRNATTIELLNYEVEHLSKTSIPLKVFLENNYALNGKWYQYTYSSHSSTQNHQLLELDIQNSTVKATFPTKVLEGEVYPQKEYTLLMFEHSIIKIHNFSIKDDIFRVSIIGKERKIHNRDVLLFGLMSRMKLRAEKVEILLDSIHRKGDDEYWLKVSNEFETTLAYFDLG